MIPQGYPLCARFRFGSRARQGFVIGWAGGRDQLFPIVVMSGDSFEGADEFDHVITLDGTDFQVFRPA